MEKSYSVGTYYLVYMDKKNSILSLWFIRQLQSQPYNTRIIDQGLLTSKQLEQTMDNYEAIL